MRLGRVERWFDGIPRDLTWGYIALYVLCGAVVLFNSALVPLSIAVGRWDLVIQNLMSALVPLGLLVVVEIGRRSLD